MRGDSVLADPLPIEPLARPFDGVIRVPGSKSISNRHLVLAALADGEVALNGLLACDDCDRLSTALAAFGVTSRREGDATLLGRSALPEVGSVNLGDGGTPTRFMIAFAAAQPSGVWTIDGSARMRERPVAEGIDMLRALGARIEYIEAEGRLPVRVHGGSMRGGTVEVGRTASSQFVSALLLVAPRLERGVEVRFAAEPTSASYIQLSLAALADAGIDAEVAYGPTPVHAASAGAGLRMVRIAPQRIAGGVRWIEPDASSAVYPAALAAITGSRVRLEGLPRRSMQPDAWFLEDLALHGAEVRESVPTEDASNARLQPATIVAGSSSFHGGDRDYARAPDASVMAMVAAAGADRPSRFTGLGTLRVKESDRIDAVATGLRALGGRVETGPDWATVHPLPERTRPAAIDTVNDHRIAMAFAVLGLARPGVSIRNPGCVGKSWPGYWDAIRALTCENPPR
ncbi:MAG: 3-phosphoshikimate 1-carboxyvinyltransferase [Planctomycetota bacterium]